MFRPTDASRRRDLALSNLRLANGYVKSTSMSRRDVSSTLTEEVERLAAESKARATAVSVHDLESGLRFSLRGDRWLHAASTIKVGVLLALFGVGDAGLVPPDDE